jgi:large subunit ribosomal protein LP1
VATEGRRRRRWKGCVTLLLLLLLLQSPMSMLLEYPAYTHHDLSFQMQGDKIVSLTTAAGCPVEPIWATLLAKALDGKSVKDMLTNVGSGSGGAAIAAAPAAGGAAGGAAPAEEKKEEKKEEEKEESDGECGGKLYWMR